MITTAINDKTLYLLQNRNVQLTLRKIAEETGLDEAWLSAFNRQKISDPGVNKVQTLYEYLTKTTIVLV